MDDLMKLRPKYQGLLDETTKIYKCEICDKEFKKNDGLKSHFNYVHNFVKGLHCNICQKKPKSSLALNLRAGRIGGIKGRVIPIPLFPFQLFV